MNGERAAIRDTGIRNISPYIVRVLIRRLKSEPVADGVSDFDESVTIQESEPTCEGWNLEQFSAELAKRLAKY